MFQKFFILITFNYETVIRIQKNSLYHNNKNNRKK